MYMKMVESLTNNLEAIPIVKEHEAMAIIM